MAPRPLPAHLTAAMMLWLSSRIALPWLKNASLQSSIASKRLRALIGEIDAAGSDRFSQALDHEIVRRFTSYLAGIEAYRCHPFRRRRAALPVLWREGSTQLLDAGNDGGGPAVLVVPSLINRYYVLDLLPERSFLRELASHGLRPLVVDWGVPGSEERSFDLTDYVAGRLESAFAAATRIAGAPMAIVGYCMGGLLALALALRRRRQVSCLALLATPWDFHAEREEQARLLGLAGDFLPLFCAAARTVPAGLLQSLFFFLDPFAAERKYIRFAALEPEGSEARVFVALEDWINDGVPLALEVARNCARSWYGENEPGRGVWRVAGQRVCPKLLRRPALVVIPGRDRIVPPSSAEPLAAELGGATVLRPPLGHIGMMSATSAPEMLWTPLAQWLRARFHER
jgi:polyhydroxyalkanoate synthase subunit PhaC